MDKAETSNMDDIINNTNVETMEDLNQRYADSVVYVIVFLAVLAPIGVVGNMIVLVVYSVSKTYRDTNFKIFVIWLACVDLLSCLTIIPVEIVSLQMVYTFQNAILCKMKCFFQVFFNTVVGLALLIIALERYIKICHPLRRQINRGLAKKIVFIVVLFAILLCIPAPIMCGISTENKTNIYNTTTQVKMCEVEKDYENSIIRMVYKSTFTFLLLILSVAIIVMYGLILRTTCIVRRKMASQHRTCESVRLSNKYLNRIDTETDIFINTGNSSTELSLVFNKDEKETNEKNDNRLETPRDSPALSRNSSALNGDSSRRKDRLTINRNDDASITSRARPKSYISDCGISSKTLIWLILTFVFIVTYFLYTILAYYTTTQYMMTPSQLTFYKFLMRIYFVNNIINPVIYTWLDKGFRISCKDICFLLKSKCCFE